jgi:hypothetical protein
MSVTDHPGWIKGKQRSNKTKHKQKQKRISEYEKNPNQCNWCNIPLPYGKRTYSFCSKSCAASYNNQGVRRHGSPKTNRKTCLHCESNLQHLRNERGRKFCSIKCSSKYRSKQVLQKWISNPSEFKHFPKPARRWLMNKSGYKCELCGWNEMNPYTKTIPLEIDHIDGHYQNNLLENLRVLCPNCHSLTPTYKAANRGHGRPHRRS